MRRTSVGLLAVLALLAGVIGWLGQIALTEAGSATFVPPRTVIVVLLLLAVILVVLGWPVRQAVRGRGARIDPFRATRVLMFAKAASPTGALLTGAAVGLLAFVLTRGVPPAVGTLVSDAGALVAALVLAVAGVLVEGWCRLPPEDDERARDAHRAVPR